MELGLQNTSVVRQNAELAVLIIARRTRQRIIFRAIGTIVGDSAELHETVARQRLDLPKLRTLEI